MRSLYSNLDKNYIILLFSFLLCNQPAIPRILIVSPSFQTYL